MLSYLFLIAQVLLDLCQLAIQLFNLGRFALGIIKGYLKNKFVALQSLFQLFCLIDELFLQLNSPPSLMTKCKEL